MVGDRHSRRSPTAFIGATQVGNFTERVLGDSDERCQWCPPDPQIYRCPRQCALIGHLSNSQFVTELDRLISRSDGSVVVAVRLADDAKPKCRCGCGSVVARGRTFVNQRHYSEWLRAERYVGKNRR